MLLEIQERELEILSEFKQSDGRTTPAIFISKMKSISCLTEGQLDVLVKYLDPTYNKTAAKNKEQDKTINYSQFVAEKTDPLKEANKIELHIELV